MNKNFLTVLSLFIFICLMTLVISFSAKIPAPSVLGATTAALKFYDDGNGTLYLEYSNPQDVYNSISSWQGKYPGRTIYSSSPLVSGSTKYSAIIFTYTGR